MVKNDIRRKNKLIRASFSDTYVIDVSDSVCKRIMNTNEYINADIVCGYMSFRNEIDISRIIQDGLNNKIIALPKVIKDVMKFYIIKSKDDLKAGYMGIYEPTDGLCELNQYIELNGISKNKVIFIVPGLTFDRELYRLGYGGGYYDKYFTANKYGQKIGACYNSLIYEKLPHEDYDIKCDMVITEKEILYGC